MLDGLNDIDWSRVNHAYGTCEQVPGMLRQLARGDSVSHVLGWLQECCFHQETHYEANGVILPFLLEIAGSPETPGRERILPTLLDWFWGIEDLEPPKSPAQWRSYWQRFDSTSSIRGIHDADNWRRLKQRTMRAAWESRARLLKLMDDPAPKVRAIGATLLALMIDFGHHSGGSYAEDVACSWAAEAAIENIARRLRNSALRDDAMVVRIAATFSLGAMRDCPVAAECSREIWRSVQTPAERTAAAMACMVGPSAPCSETLESLLDGLLHSTLYVSSLADVPWLRSRHADFNRLGLLSRLQDWLGASPHPLSELVSMLRQRIAEGDPLQRRGAMHILAAMSPRNEACAPILEAGLSDSDSLTRVSAAVGLWSPTGNGDAAQFIEAFRPALQSPDDETRRQGLAGLKTMWTELHPDDEVWLRAEQLQAKHADAGQLVDGLPAWLRSRCLPLAVPMLVEAANAEPLLDLRMQYCEVFQRVGYECKHHQTGDELDPPGVERLMELIYRWAQDGDLGPKAASSGFLRLPEQKRAVAKQWIALIRQGHANRERLVYALGWLKLPETLEVFIHLLSQDHDDVVRVHAAYHIRWLDSDHTALQLMLAQLTEGTLRLAKEACHYLSMHGADRDEVADRMIACLLDDARSRDGERLRPLLIKTVRSMRAQIPAVAAALYRVAMTDEDEQVVRQAIGAMALPLLLHLSDDEVERLLRGNATAALELLESFEHGCGDLPDHVVSLLESLLDHNDHRVRKAALGALRNVAETPARQKLVCRHLRDRHRDVRRKALWFDYKALGPDEFVPAILDMLNCEQPDWLAWSRLARIAPIESQLEGAKLVVRHGNGELLMRVVEWIQKVEARDDALEAEILGRLNRGQLD
ncbi:MAG: hypothetical protein KDB14_05760, partial [Planctomycetales bacterium]|nr:hypothetical protein [Planctomycetales bacterium]